MSQNFSVSGPVMSEQAAVAARRKRATNERGLRRDIWTSRRGKVQRYISWRPLKCLFLNMNCQFLIKICLFLT